MEQSKRFESLDMRILNKGFLKKKKSKSKYLNLLFTGDEGIEPSKIAISIPFFHTSNTVETRKPVFNATASPGSK